jgi:hypothetical protein
MNRHFASGKVADFLMYAPKMMRAAVIARNAW